MKLWVKNLILVLAIAAILVIPLIVLRDAEFAGADGLAEEAITQIAPDYEPWAQPISEPASGEIESMLFALQAAVGSGIVCFILGRITAKKKEDAGK